MLSQYNKYWYTSELHYKYTMCMVFFCIFVVLKYFLKITISHKAIVQTSNFIIKHDLQVTDILRTRIRCILGKTLDIFAE